MEGPPKPGAPPAPKDFTSSDEDEDGQLEHLECVHFSVACFADDVPEPPPMPFRYVLQLRDHFSKYVLLEPLPDKKSATVSAILWRMVAYLGVPKIIHSDNGGEFA